MCIKIEYHVYVYWFAIAIHVLIVSSDQSSNTSAMKKKSIVICIINSIDALFVCLFVWLRQFCVRMLMYYVLLQKIIDAFVAKPDHWFTIKLAIFPIDTFIFLFIQLNAIQYSINFNQRIDTIWTMSFTVRLPNTMAELVVCFILKCICICFVYIFFCTFCAKLKRMYLNLNSHFYLTYLYVSIVFCFIHSFYIKK